MILIFLLIFSLCFAEEIDLYSDKTLFENNTFTFSQNVNVLWENNTFSSKKAKLEYPLLEMSEDLCFILEDSKIYSDRALINLEKKTGTLFSENLIHVKEETLDLFCKKAELEKDKITLTNQVLLKFSQGEITSDKIEVFSFETSKKIKGCFKGVLGKNLETTFDYDGFLVYDKETQNLSTEDSPFFLEDKNFNVFADKATFYLKKGKGLDKVILNSIEKPVEILSGKINALADTITYLPKEKTYILKSTTNNRVLILKDQDQLSAKEIHIIKQDGTPEIKAKGVCHFTFSKEETNRFKNLVTHRSHAKTIRD